MGLDMYLNKMPRYKNVTAKQVEAIGSYFDWIKAKNEGSEYANCTFKEWCGHDIEDLPSIEAIEFFRQFYGKKYQTWDTYHEYGHDSVYEQVGYWRKANAIHNWFVNHVQDGEDDCDYHQEVTKGVLEDLLETCTKVLNHSVMVIGVVKNGESFENGKWKDNFELGKVIIDSSVAEDLLPTTSGFFFGSTDYDEYYVDDIKHTIEVCQNVLETTDFDKEMLYYVSSW